MSLSRQDVRLYFLELDQGAVEVPGVEEEDGQAMSTDLGLAIAEDAGAAGGEMAGGVDEVGDLEADVVHTAGRMLGEEFRAYLKSIASRL